MQRKGTEELRTNKYLLLSLLVHVLRSSSAMHSLFGKKNKKRQKLEGREQREEGG